MFQTFAIALAMLCIAPAPAVAQRTVSSQENPPAPTPTIDRDQRNRDVTPGQPVQWELRGADRIDPNMRYAIYNLRRSTLGKEAQLAFYDCGSGSVCNDATRWNPNGGMFEFRRAPSPVDRGAIVVEEYVAIYNTKTRRYLKWFGTWDNAPQYIWQLRGLRTDKVKRSVTFSLYNVGSDAYLILKESGVRTFIDNQSSDLSLIKYKGRIDRSR